MWNCHLPNRASPVSPLPHPQELTNWYWVFLRPVELALLLVFHLGFGGQSLNEQCLFSCKSSECLRVSAIYSIYCFLIAPLSTPGGHLCTFDSLLPALHGKQQRVQWSCIRQDWTGIPACPPWVFCASVPWVVNCGEWPICGIERWVIQSLSEVPGT